MFFGFDSEKKVDSNSRNVEDSSKRGQGGDEELSEGSDDGGETDCLGAAK